jgi:hypothetical protein
MREHADQFGGVPEVLEDDPTIIEGAVSLETQTEVPQEPVN